MSNEKLKTVNSIDPKSALRVGFMLSIAAGIILIIMTAVLWLVLNSMSLFSHVLSFISSSGISDSSFDLGSFLSFPKLLALATIIAIINVAVLTVLSFLFAHIYNVTTRLVGGLKVTLSDD
ncbi:MAG: DUF3566 domain-containing protein [Bifidobacteriaceae bacterium]|jgi:hypothetical protein|nr:DUF3566 domain-containing protein [Bifidobacteriaceae bacterium]